jgi:hypothetical protein
MGKGRKEKRASPTFHYRFAPTHAHGFNLRCLGLGEGFDALSVDVVLTFRST